MADELTRRELHDLWQGETGYPPTKHRPAWVREHRDALMAHLDVSEPIPDDGSNAEIARWLDRYRGTVTRQLNDDAEGTDPHDEAEDAETPTAGDTEGGD